MKRAVSVVPAILTDSTVELSRLVSLANTFAPFVQVDIMDGVFVPTRSVLVEDLRVQDIRFRWEVHLMVSAPLEYLKPFRDAGATRVVFHYESEADPCQVIAHARDMGLGVGLAVNPPTPAASIAALLPLVDTVLLMTVYPGYYGARFVPEVMSKVEEVRRACPDVKIGVDGGIKEDNLLDVARYGVDTVCVGSAIFASADPAASYARLASVAEKL